MKFTIFYALHPIVPMTPADISGVIEVEQTAYGQNFSQKDYRRELEYNQLAHYFVLRGARTAALPAELTNIIGVAGFWLVAGQIHVITLATHPSRQGRGLGEWQLLHLLASGLVQGAETRITP